MLHQQLVEETQTPEREWLKTKAKTKGSSHMHVYIRNVRIRILTYSTYCSTASSKKYT